MYSSVDKVPTGSLMDHEVTPEFWIPPDAADQRDGVWGPSSFRRFGEEGSADNKFQEEKTKAINDVKNGKFRTLVSQFLRTVYVDSSGNCDDDWVDIAAALSWEAASFVNPDPQKREAVDPNEYVKIKCISTGLRTESKLIKGLVINAGPEHTPVEYKNPRILLVRGSLDLSLGGLSSMKQEKDKFKSTIQMIDTCRPNIVLVEKSVSQDIQEHILAKGITLVSDIRLHLLERVASWFPPPTLASGVATGQKLRQCDSFRLEAFVEEHAVSTAAGTEQNKTLIFLDGAPTQLGCTILLMGASSNELKRIKVVVQHSVNMAYHMMLETSFLLDQSAMFSTISSNEGLDLALINTQSMSAVTDEATTTGQKWSDAEPDTSQTCDEVVDEYGDQSRNEINPGSDSESILVLMSSHNVSRGTICEKSHFSVIKYYGDLDVPVGKYLEDNLLNETLSCSSCGESPKVHVFYYVHRNRQLTIQVRHLPERSFAEESEEKLWMWGRCGRCEFHDRVSTSTRRVSLSKAACGLSFGKFLELGFSSHSSFSSPSSCGHSFHKDFLFFFGLRSMVAMFKYSPVVTYFVSLPPQKIDFSHSVLGSFLKREYEDVYSKGSLMFLEISNLLKDLVNQHMRAPLNIQGTDKEFEDIVQMLNQEKSKFENDIQNAINNEPEDDDVHKTLNLNRIRMDLLLESHIWDQRLHALPSSDLKLISSGTAVDKGLTWAPFSDIRRAYMEDFQRGNTTKFESCGSYAAESTAQKLISDEGSRLHIPLGLNDYIVSDYENELSSIIACALALLKDVAIGTADAQRESPQSSSFDSLNSLVLYGDSHSEVSMGSRIYPEKHKYSVLCIQANKFRQLRDLCCPEVEYIASLSRCMNLDTEGGKDKSFVSKTLDDRFIVRDIKRTECDAFLKFAGNYFEYLNQCYEEGQKTCLAKILGIYQVVIRATNGKETRRDLMVMENLFSGRRQMDRQYDLKGAPDSRVSTPGITPGGILLDQNFVNDVNVSPLYISKQSNRHLQQALFNDTVFLSWSNVMDYSLLVGMDTQRCELVCGIIDYLKQYTWDKQLENWIKSPFVPKNKLPISLPPKEYKRRFRKFIATYFSGVLDNWCP